MSWISSRRTPPDNENEPDGVVDLLLAEAGRRQELEVKTVLEVPTQDLVERTGYDWMVLRNAGALPQPFRERYKLAVSHAASVNRTAFECLGIPLCLASASTIAETWKTYILRCPPDEAEERLFQDYRDYTARLCTPQRRAAGDILLPF